MYGNWCNLKFSDLYSAGSGLYGAGSGLYAAASGSGGGHYCEDGIPTEAALLSLLAAFAVSYAILYMASTTNKSGRKKRDDPDGPIVSEMLKDFLWEGMIAWLSS